MITKTTKTVLIFVVPMIVLAIFVPRKVKTWGKEKAEEKARTELVRREIVKPSTEHAWLYQTDKADGYYDGENHPSEGKMVMIQDDDEAMMFRVFYDCQGTSESTVFFLDRNKRDGLGTWVKENPKETGAWKLKPESFQTIKPGYCISWRSNDKDTATWYSANLRRL